MNLPSMPMVPLPALSSTFLALRCECMFRAPGARTQTLFPGWKRDGCCGPHLSHREQVRCFSSSSVSHRAGRPQQAGAVNSFSNRDFLHQVYEGMFRLQDGWKRVSLLFHRTRLLEDG